MREPGDSAEGPTCPYGAAGIWTPSHVGESHHLQWQRLKCGHLQHLWILVFF